MGCGDIFRAKKINDTHLKSLCPMGRKSVAPLRNSSFPFPTFLQKGQTALGPPPRDSPSAVKLISPASKPYRTPYLCIWTSRKSRKTPRTRGSLVRSAVLTAEGWRSQLSARQEAKAVHTRQAESTTSETAAWNKLVRNGGVHTRLSHQNHPVRRRRPCDALLRKVVLMAGPVVLPQGSRSKAYCDTTTGRFCLMFDRGYDDGAISTPGLCHEPLVSMGRFLRTEKAHGHATGRRCSCRLPRALRGTKGDCIVTIRAPLTPPG